MWNENEERLNQESVENTETTENTEKIFTEAPKNEEPTQEAPADTSYHYSYIREPNADTQAGDIHREESTRDAAGTTAHSPYENAAAGSTGADAAANTAGNSFYARSGAANNTNTAGSAAYTAGNGTAYGGTGTAYSSAGAAYNSTGAAYGSGQSYTAGTAQNGTAPKAKTKKLKKKGSHHWLKVAVSALVFGILAGVAFTGVRIAANMLFPSAAGGSDSRDTSRDTTVETTAVTTGTVTENSTVASTVAENGMPSIVAITNSSVQEVQSFFGGSTEQEIESAGSGIIVGKNDTELLLVTNYHVVEEATTITVTFVDEESAEAKLKGGDSGHDVAVLAIALDDISDDTMGQIKIATLGDSDVLKVGETAIAIGNALNYGQSVTEGIISALDRTVEKLGIEGSLIQTDAATNPGNSGGALFNASGEVIGINVAKEFTTESSTTSSSSRNVESMCYAIPISDVKDLINSLMNEETKEEVAEEDRGVLGVQVQTIDSTTAAAYNMPTGIYVSKVISGTGAYEAGIETGDVITQVEGMSVSSYNGLQTALSYYEAGETVTVTVQRANKEGTYEEMTFEVTLSEQS